MIKDIETRIKVDKFHRIRAFLLEKFISAQERNESFSLRSYANVLNISAGNLSLFFRQSRGLSKNDFEKIVEYYKFSKEETEYFKPIEFKKPDNSSYEILEVEQTENLWSLMLILPFVQYYQNKKDLFDFLLPYGIENDSVNDLFTLLEQKEVVSIDGDNYEFKKEMGALKIVYNFEKPDKVHELGLKVLDQIKAQVPDGPYERYYAHSIVPLSHEDFNDIQLKIKILREELLSDIVASNKEKDEVKPYIFQTSLIPIKPK